MAGATASNNKEKEKEKKEKERKKREAEKFDNNVDADAIGHYTSDESGKETNYPGSSTKKTDLQGLDQFCATLKKGFENLSTCISEKLDKVGEKVGNSLNDVHDSLNQQMQEIGSWNQTEEEGAWQDDESTQEFQHGDTHAMSDTSENAPSCSDTKKESFFKKKNTPRPLEKVGDKVDQDLADIINRSFSTPIQLKEFNEFREKNVRPQNVDWLTVPEVPYNVYRRLSSDFKDKDKHLKFLQEQLCPVAISLSYAMDKLGSGDFEGGMETLSETLNAFGYVYKNDITEKRRSLIKQKLPDDFKVLASDKCAATPTNLLGNVSESTKKIAETEKLASQMDKATKHREDLAKRIPGRSKPYERGNSYFNGGGQRARNMRRGSFYGRGTWGRYNRRGDGYGDNYRQKNYSNGENANNSGKSYFQRRGQQYKK